MDNKLLNVKSFKTLYSALLMKFKSMIKKSDWNQNDKNADDYIKNRTHYTEVVNGVEVVHKLDEKYLPKLELGVKSWNDLEDKPFCDETETIVYLATTTLEASDFEESNEYRYQNAKYHYTGLFDTNTIEVGKTYIVNWDGVEYETQCKQWEYSNYLGMRYDDYNDGESYNEYPFGFRLVPTNVGVLKSNTINVVMAKEAGSHTFSIYEKFEEIHKLDEKYIPDTIARTAEVETKISDELSKLGGTVEITSEAPTKDNTVLTIDPNAEEVNVYTAEEVDEKIKTLNLYIISTFEELKTLISNNETDAAVALLDNAILDLSTLA